MKRMLFNATHAEQLRVAIVDGQKLLDLDIESSGREQRKSNIYKGVVTRVEPSLEACFVDYGEERHGFLPFKEISRQYFKPGVDVGRARINEAISEGQEIIIQVEKEERGNKGAALTTFISLAGRYLVLMPNNPRGGGVSRRVEGEDRQELRDAIDQLDLPNGMSVIARTAGIGRVVEELQWDLKYLLQLWKAITDAVDQVKAPELIYLESSLVIRAIRDYFNPDIGEILIDTEDVYEQARTFVDLVMPDVAPRVKRYKDDVPLFSRFQIEHQIETAHSRTVTLPSGGAIVIDHTEALVAIDVNSAQATRGADIEETATRTNLEAADEAARQLRLRDLGGLIVIDFIDMEEGRNQRAVEQRLKDALHFDRARVQMGKISRFGLMELSRQRLRPALSEGSHVTCPRCNGVGQVRDTDSSALHILRIIQEEAMKESTAAVHAQVPVDVATYLLNEKRADITKLEARLRVSIVLIPNRYLETPHYSIERLRHDDERLDVATASYDRVIAPPTDEPYAPPAHAETRNRKQTAVVKGIVPDSPAPLVSQAEAAAPAPSAAPEGGFWSRIRSWFGGEQQTRTPKKEPAAARSQERSAGGADRGKGGRHAERRGGRGGRTEQGERSERRDRRPERGERGARAESGRGERSASADRTERPERADRADRAERPERGDRAERGERADRTERSEAQGGARRRDESRRERGNERGARARGGNGSADRDADNRGERESAQGGREGAQRREPPAAPIPVPAVPANEMTPAPDSVKADEAVAGDARPAARPEGGEDEKRSRRRRRRRGRGGERGAEAAAGLTQDDDEADEGAREVNQAPQGLPVRETSHAPMAPAPAFAPVAPVIERAPEPVPAHIRVDDTPIPPQRMDVESLAPALQAAGVELAQTDPAKLAAAQERIAHESDAPRLGRERPRREAPPDEPLVQVQTRP